MSSCGSPATVSTFVPSKNCHVSATNYNFAGCDLSHRNLSHLDLESDDFERANLTGTNFDYSNLQGANLKKAKLSGVLTNDLTICVNAEIGPCSEPGLTSPKTSDATQGE